MNENLDAYQLKAYLKSKGIMIDDSWLTHDKFFLLCSLVEKLTKERYK